MNDFLARMPRLEFIKPPTIIQSPPVEFAPPSEAETPPLLRIGRNYSLDTQHYIQTGEKDFIVAMTGMGKSWLVGVLAEQTLDHKITICAIDPHGEMYTLKERYQVLIVGGEHADVPLSLETVPVIVEAMLADGISTIFDLSQPGIVDSKNRDAEFVYCGLILRTLFELQRIYKLRMRLIVEEAQLFAAQSEADKECLAIMKRIAKEGRKMGIDSVHATQRFASLNKDVLSQCNRKWIGHMEAEQDLEAAAPVIREAKINVELIKALEPGQFYLYARGETVLVEVANRKCTHGGKTPELKRGKYGGKKEIDKLIAKVT